MTSFAVFFIIFTGSLVFKQANAKELPVGSCIANNLLCNFNEKNIDPWEIKCGLGAFLKIDKIGKRSYKTSCLERTLNCKDFVSFKDVQLYYFKIDCPVQKNDVFLNKKE